MASLIDSTKPTTGQALTADVRQNFQHAKDEIEALQDTVTSSFANLAAFPVTGLANKIYIALDTDIAYYWDGAAYVAFAAGSVVGAVMFNAVQSLTDPQKAQARSNIDAAGVGVSGIVFIGAMDVSALPVLGPTDRAIAIANNAIWSGGVGCLVRWSGSAWLDPDGNVAAVVLRAKTHNGGGIINAIIPPAFGSMGVYQGHESNFLLFANVYDTVVTSGISAIQNVFDLSAATGGTIASGATGVIEVTLATPRNFIKALALASATNLPSRILLEADLGAGYITVFDDTSPVFDVNAGVSPTTVYYIRSTSGMSGIDVGTPTQKLRLSVFNTSPGSISLRFWAMYDQALAPFSRSHLMLDGSNWMRNDLEIRKGSAAQIGTGDNFNLELKRNNTAIATLTAAGLDALRLFYAGQDTDTRYVLQSALTELVEDIVGAFATDSTFINVVYDDLTNTILWTLIDETITEQKLNTLLAAKVNGNHNHTASQVTDFAESVDDRVAALIQAGANITLTYDDVLNTLTIAATAPAPGAGGSPGQLQFNDAGALAGADKVDVDTDGNLTMDTAYGAVAAPSADKVKIFGRKAGGRGMLAIEGPSGLDTILQPHIGRNKIATWIPAGNSTTITADGAAALTATGTATAANVAVTNRHTLMRRLEYLVTVAATTAVAGFRSTVAQFLRGSNAGDGGFHYVCRWGPATGVATATNRAFVGMNAATAAPTDVEPSSIVNILGMGWDAADTNIQFMHNDASGAATKIDLGASFPVPTADRTKVYELAMFCAPAGTEIFYEVTDLATGDKATGSVTTDIPAATTLLAPRGWMSVGGTSSVIGIALMGLYIETDY